MGEKRKSKDAELGDVSKSHKKKNKKHCHAKIQHTTNEDQSASIFPHTRQSRITQLKKLIQEISDEQDIDDARPDIIELLKKLGRSLAEPEFLDNSIPQLSRPLRPVLEASSVLQTHIACGLPSLPAIKDRGLEIATFTHPGVVNEQKITPGTESSYDRLEVLGDAYIEIIATRLVWARYPALPAGRLSQIRERLVKNETLAQYATQYGFEKRAIVPPGHIDQLKRWTKIRGDIFEAYVAAVILSDPVKGYESAENWLTQIWLPKLTDIRSEQPNLTFKEELAKKIMGKGIKVRYVDERPHTTGPDSIRTFFVGVYLTGWGWKNQHLGSGQGMNKVEAGNEAARNALENQPLIDKIAAVKRSFDQKVKAEREQESNQSIK